MNIHDFQNKKRNHQKISMLTCYDYSMAAILNKTNIDCLLVGDSAAMVMHGHSTTLNISTELLAIHTLAVTKGAPDKFVVSDLPFLSYRKGLTENMRAMEKLMKAGAHALKLEGADGNLKLIKHAVQSGIPVMGHLGLTPQSVNTLGGFKVQGRDELAQKKIHQQALDLQDAGCFSIVLECVPSHLAEKMTQDLEIPTIGIGAGPNTDGQVLVLQDMLGMNLGFSPKFLRKFAQLNQAISEAANKYHEDTLNQNFPNKEESYS